MVCVCVCVFPVYVRVFAGVTLRKMENDVSLRVLRFFSPGWCSVIAEWAGLCVRVTATKYAVGCRL